MEAVCIKHADKKPGMEEFKKVTQPVIEWLQNNGCPHDVILIKYDSAEMLSGEMAYSVEVPD